MAPGWKGKLTCPLCEERGDANLLALVLSSEKDVFLLELCPYEDGVRHPPRMGASANLEALRSLYFGGFTKAASCRHDQ